MTTAYVLFKEDIRDVFVEKSLIQTKINILKQNSDNTLSSLKLVHKSMTFYYDINNMKNASQEELILYKKDLIQYVKGLAVDDKNYYWISDTQEKIAMHPFRKDLEKKHFQDIVNTTEVIKKNESMRIVKYTILDINNEISSRHAVLYLFEPFGWEIGKNFKMEDVNNEISLIEEELYTSYMQTINIVFIFTLLFIISIFYIILKISNKTIFEVMEDDLVELNNELLEKNLSLSKQFYYDELTGIPNMNSLKIDIDNNEYATLFMIDIESFNNINKFYGYNTGDKILIEYANVLKDFAEEKSYKCYRLYSNTFALLGEKEGFKVDEYYYDIQNIIHNYTDISIQNTTEEYKDLNIQLDVHLGISLYQDNVIIKANTALEEAKKDTKRYYIYTGAIKEHIHVKKYLDTKILIEKAIKLDSVVPYFQPIVNKEKENVKYESLMRLHINDTILYPNDFMDISIKTKLYTKLSMTLIRKVLAKAKTLNKNISINLSTIDFLNQELVEILDEYLNIDNIDLCKLVTFEILESQNIDDFDFINSFLGKYRNYGVKIAIDDFGSGYSNFSHILQLKPDYIKIDGSLIKNIDKNKDNLELVKSIINFTKTLGIITIAEFIHNENIFTIVKNLGVDQFQGYYFAKPQEILG